MDNTKSGPTVRAIHATVVTIESDFEDFPLYGTLTLSDDDNHDFALYHRNNPISPVLRAPGSSIVPIFQIMSEAYRKFQEGTGVSEEDINQMLHSEGGPSL